MSEPVQEVFSCDTDGSLGMMLARLFSEGHEEVEIQHPTEGTVVVTRQDFENHLASVRKVANLSPAQRIEANKRIKNIKNAKQIRFRTAMLEAPIHTVDIEDDDNFGKDVNGEQLDIDGMVFIPIHQYLPGIEVVEQELGVFVDESDKRPPIRIKQLPRPAVGQITPAG